MLLTHLDEDSQYDVYRPKNCFRKKIILASLFVVLFLAAIAFLVWDHVAYKDETPPTLVQVWRNISAIFLMLSVVALSWQIAIFLKSRGGVGKEWIFGMILYILAGLVWGVCYFYYSSGEHRHDMPAVVNVIQWICLCYVGLVSLCIFLFILSQLPPESLLLCFLMFNN